MLHLIGLSPAQADALEALKKTALDTDLFIFADAGWLLADTLLNSDSPVTPKNSYLLCTKASPSNSALPSSLPPLSPSELVNLIAEHGPITSWY